MKRYAQLIAIYVTIALAVVLIYAPWGLALRPWDYDLLRAGFSIIAGIGLAGVFGTSTYLLLKDPDVKLLEPAAVLDDDDVVPVLEEYSQTPYVGAIALEALEQVRSAGRKRERLRKVISIQFSEGSMSWDKFCGLVDMAERTVLRNSALVANGVQSFDREGYKAALRSKNQKSEQLALYDRSIASMRDIIEANERVLLEMGKLELELSSLETDDTREAASETIEELQGLIEETRYYH
ncbi:MAG: hypothetical protein Q4A07_09215 [Coriobacteriales bacterium]|nr:hypothetical protein [Coriobacteriales bacterium]